METTAIKDLKRHLSDMKMMCLDEIKAREKLGRERTAKLSEMAAMEAAISTGREKHGELLENLREAKDAKIGDLEKRIQSLRKEQQELEVELGSWEVSRETNDRLRREVFNARNASEEEAKTIREERDRITTAAFDLRMDYERTTRQTLRDLDRTYQERAPKDLKGRAHLAKKQNQKLGAVIDLRTTEAEQALADQTTRWRKLGAAKVDHELFTQAKASHDDRLATLQRSLEQADRWAAHRQDDVAKRHVALRKVQADYAALKHGLRDLSNINAVLGDSQHTARKRRATALYVLGLLKKAAASLKVDPQDTSLSLVLQHLNLEQSEESLLEQTSSLFENGNTMNNNNDDEWRSSMLFNHIDEEEDTTTCCDDDPRRIWNSDFARDEGPLGYYRVVPGRRRRRK